MTKYLLAIDQGTTSSRAMVFDERGQVMASAQQEFPQYFPHDGWVEHDGMEILRSVMDVLSQVMDSLPDGIYPTAMGITNQRETTLIWDRDTGVPIAPAIVWQDRRTTDLCQKMKQDGLEERVSEKTGLLLDPYFSATKIKWILDNVGGARARADRGELAFGTVDSFLLWHLTEGQVHGTDVSNAARTLLFNIRDMAWDPDLLHLFDIPESLLSQVKASDHHFGDMTLFDQSIPITGIAGDQQAALIGQNCLSPGQVKCTYGTGGFIMMNVGDKIIRSQNRLLTTVAYEIQGKVAYALEGSFFCAGSAVQWLRDGLKIITHASETEALARSVDSTGGVYMVPAFTGLGAPHWNPAARGSLLGLTRGTGRAEIARAALESVGYQTADLLAAMTQDTGISCEGLRVDGGMVGNDWLLQFLADVLQVGVVCAQVPETTAYGVARLAGIGSGVFRALDERSEGAEKNNPRMPGMDVGHAISLRENWNNAVKSTCYYSKG